MDFQERLNVRSRGSWKWLAIMLSVLIYLAFVTYTEIHMYDLVQRFLPDGLKIFGVAAVAVTALSAVALPLSMHFWVRTGKQKTVLQVFYAFHLIFLASNLVLNSARHAGYEVAEFVSGIYGSYVLPAVVVIYAIGWIMVWALDSAANRAEHKLEIEEEMEDARLGRKLVVVQEQNEALIRSFKSRGAKMAIARWAAENAPKLLAEELGLNPDELPEEDMKYWVGVDGKSKGKLKVKAKKKAKAKKRKKAKAKKHRRHRQMVATPNPNGLPGA